MPGFDGTGPMGAGPMTGGGRGYCNPSLTTYGPAILPRSGRGGVNSVLWRARGITRGYNSRGSGYRKALGGRFGRRFGFR